MFQNVPLLLFISMYETGRRHVASTRIGQMEISAHRPATSTILCWWPEVTMFSAHTNTDSSSHPTLKSLTGWNICEYMTMDDHFTFYLWSTPRKEAMSQDYWLLKIGCHKDVWGGARFLLFLKPYATSLNFHGYNQSQHPSQAHAALVLKRMKNRTSASGQAWIGFP